MSVQRDKDYDEADLALLPQNLFKKRLLGTTKMYGKSLSVCPMVTHELYDMDNPNRGFAVIVDNNAVKDELSGEKQSLQRFLEWLGYDVRVWRNCSASSIKDLMFRVSSWDHKDSDALVCVISTTAVSSSGEEESTQAADGSVSMDTLTSLFSDENCRSLAGKPKLFFLLQTIITDADEEQQLPERLSFQENEEENHDLASLTKDSLVIMSQQIIHNTDFPDTDNGNDRMSEFIKILQKVIKSTRCFDDVDILTQLGVVNRQMITCVHTPSKLPRPQTLHMKPVLCYFSTLTKRLCLKPKT